MVIDLALCMRCRACMVACKTEHQIPAGRHAGHEYYRITVLEYERGHYPATRRVFAPILCMHCEVAPCIDACPVPGAIYRRADGIVVISQHKCDGCKRCLEICPYCALYFDEERCVVDKCDFCAGRIDRGLEPACVSTCMGRAMFFGDLDDPDSEVYRLARKAGTGPDRPLSPPHFGQTFKPAVYYNAPDG